ncbi:MAG: tetraacyldisaccharide 4'-kinase [Deltaproteobacteria bacterium]|nr:tetraacyldisaccharide 4'-kinase [Deltaproteobacteria bacterium]
MKGTGPDWPRIYRKSQFGFWTILLIPFSALYGLGVKLRLWAYRIKIFKKKALPAFVLSIGNLTAGGTGKTPAVAMLAEWALKSGHKVAILSRGYGRQNRENLLEVSDEKSIKARPEHAGDEPYLLARMLPGVPVVISKNRHMAGLYAKKKYGSDFFILDDGFQHIKLKRDFNAVLIDATLPFGNGHLLPWGPLRESVSSLGRADAFILTRYRGDGSESKIIDFLRTRFPARPVFLSEHIPYKVIFPGSSKIHDPELLRGKNVIAFAGIAQPGFFKETLKNLDAEIVCFKAFRDHYWFRSDEIDSLIREKEKYGADYILTTEKDMARILPLEAANFDIGYLSIKIKLLSGEEAFFKIIRDAIEKKGIIVDTDL